MKIINFKKELQVELKLHIGLLNLVGPGLSFYIGGNSILKKENCLLKSNNPLGWGG